MISLNQLIKQKLLLNPFDLEPFGNYGQALKWAKKLKEQKKITLTLGKYGKRKTYMITEKELEKMNKEAYKLFCSRLEVLERSKKIYDIRSGR